MKHRQRAAWNNIVTYNATINAHAHKGDTQGVARLFERASVAGLVLNIVTYNAMIDAHAQKGRHGGLREAFHPSGDCKCTFAPAAAQLIGC